jgi:hypothetical protein
MSDGRLWCIKDEKVIWTLISNGFTCKPKHEEPPGPGVHFFTKTEEELQRARDANVWFITNLPIQWGKSYTLPDGSIIRSDGTELVLVSGEEAHP